MLFQDLGSRKVVADFSGGFLSCDGGALLLRQVDLSLQLSNRVAECFSDFRIQRFVEHSVPELVAQRIFGLAMGYEDLNDHNQLRMDPVIAAAVGKNDPLGLDRVHPQDRGKALAGASTLNRMELSAQCQRRWIQGCFQAVENWIKNQLVQLSSESNTVRCFKLDNSR